jgi:hypothetical protein
MTPQAILIKAAELLESSPTAWTQGRLARDDRGWPEAPNHPSACQWCAIGAIAKVQNLSEASQMYDSAAKLLASQLSGTIVYWNDHPSRTREEVIDALRKAAKSQTVTNQPSQ